MISEQREQDQAKTPPDEWYTSTQVRDWLSKVLNRDDLAKDAELITVHLNHAYRKGLQLARHEAASAVIGRIDKPLHRPECECAECLAWIAEHPLHADAEPIPRNTSELAEQLVGELCTWSDGAEFDSKVAKAVQIIESHADAEPGKAQAKFREWLADEMYGKFWSQEGLDQIAAKAAEIFKGGTDR